MKNEKHQVARFLMIKSGLVARGVKMADIAHRLGVGKASVTLVAQGKRNSKRIRAAIARASGKRVKELWG